MTDSPENEITAAVRDHKDRREAARQSKEHKRKARRWPIASIGLGIGSAALGAAVMYADRDRSKKK